MTGIVKTILICGGIVGTVIAACKINDAYKESHDGKGIIEDAADAIESHPVAATVISATCVVLALTIANSYTESHRSPEWYALQEKREETKSQIEQARLEDQRKRDEFNRLQAEKQRMDELDFYRQMPAEYWTYRSSIEDRKAREKEANTIAASSQYISDNNLEATKYISDNELEAKKVKSNSKNAKESKKEEKLA